MFARPATVAAVLAATLAVVTGSAMARGSGAYPSRAQHHPVASQAPNSQRPAWGYGRGYGRGWCYWHPYRCYYR